MVPSMRGRIVKIGVVLCGLAGAVYAAEEATNPAPPTLEQTIAQQLVAEGQAAHETGVTKAIENYTSDQMLALATQYDQEMRRAIDHAQDVKILAYRSHDIIRMTCIDDKVDQIPARPAKRARQKFRDLVRSVSRAFCTTVIPPSLTV